MTADGSIPLYDVADLERMLDGAEPVDLGRCRRSLEAEIERTRAGRGTPALLKGLAVLLYREGDVADAALIWTAKTSGFDAFVSLDAELLAGAGVERSLAFLREASVAGLPTAHYGDRLWTAAEYLEHCAAAGEATGDRSARLPYLEDRVRDLIDDWRSFGAT